MKVLQELKRGCTHKTNWFLLCWFNLKERSKSRPRKLLGCERLSDQPGNVNHDDANQRDHTFILYALFLSLNRKIDPKQKRLPIRPESAYFLSSQDEYFQNST